MIQVMLFRYLILILALAGFAKCDSTDQNTCPEGAEVQLLDLTGLDGCTLVFETLDGSRLEPLNLNAQDIEKVVGASYKIEYSERPDYASICMVGTIIEITCIERI